jgi:two-component system chemotaxis sensor kinase CheA
MLGALATASLALAPVSEATRHDIATGGVGFVFAVALSFALGVLRDRGARSRPREYEKQRSFALSSSPPMHDAAAAKKVGYLSPAEREIALLDNVDQGLFFIDRAGQLLSKPSSALLSWFGEAREGETFYEYLGRQSSRFGQLAAPSFQSWIESATSIDRVPRELLVGGREYHVAIEPVADSELLVIVSDVTTEAQRNRMLRERRETLSLFERVVADRGHVVDFLRDGLALIARVASAKQQSELIRELHTLKGTVLVLGLESVAEACHDLEERIVETGNLPTEGEIDELRARWSRVTSDVERLLGEGRRLIALSVEDYTEIERAIRQEVRHDRLLPMLTNLRLEPIEGRFTCFADQANRVASRLGKRVTANVATDGVRLDSTRWSPLWRAMIHAIRNAIDHGVESPEERVTAGKAPVAQVWFRAVRKGSAVQIEIEDDGRGVDWVAVRRRAGALGFTIRTRAELQSALFLDGLSTRDEITDISGRGLGMGALRAAVVALGGEVDVRSERGAGTLIRMTFPDAIPSQLSA